MTVLTVSQSVSTSQRAALLSPPLPSWLLQLGQPREVAGAKLLKIGAGEGGEVSECVMRVGRERDPQRERGGPAR
eukprot:CAMPEP_0180237070 /NCGR_PEP_ID=MMETSP0987-20121128/30147_1 /TAXON_ID=697907 /ORGANISM="non described non described, Strain CCMP2293" /LENGTH=74 /DNA_ID=CAMNT_0022203399 /DNA_START=152 /DNA_END=376 /DNA_ORIENTATION=-